MDALPQQFWSPLDLSPSKAPLLAKNETITQVQANVAVYIRDCLIKEFSDGLLYISTHRLIWSDSKSTARFAIHMNQIINVDFTSAFLRSSAKIIVTLNEFQLPEVEILNIKWICDVCSHVNQSNIEKCSECGSSASKQNNQQQSCPFCTYLNHADALSCSMCSQSLKSSSNTESNSNTQQITLKFSFRAGGSSTCLNALKSALKNRFWELADTTVEDSPKVDRTLGGGVSAVINSIEKSNLKINNSLDSAFSDLDNLMEKAAYMVQLAESLSSKLDSFSETASQDCESAKDRKAFQKLVQEIGVSQPVTKEITGNLYHQELAKELNTFLLNFSIFIATLIEQEAFVLRKIILALVSPEDLYRSCLESDKLGLEFQFRKFDNGLKVMQSKEYSDDAVASNLIELMKSVKLVSAVSLAKHSKISVIIAREQLLMTERNGLTCRDETIEGVFFYPNLFINPL